MSLTLAKVLSKEAAPVAAAAQLDQEALALLAEGMGPVDYLKALFQQDRLMDAVKFLAQALPPADAIRWAAVWLRQNPEAVKTAEQAHAARTVEAWLADPSEANRRAAHEAAGAAGLNSAAGCLAMAAFMSQGSVAPPEAPPVEMNPAYAARLAAGVILIATLAAEPEKAQQKFREALKAGVAIANG